MFLVLRMSSSVLMLVISFHVPTLSCSMTPVYLSLVASNVSLITALYTSRLSLSSNDLPGSWRLLFHTAC